MAWLAATFHDHVCAGTELAIFQEPWDPEAALPEQLPASVDLGIDFPDGAAAVVWVRDVIGSEAVIQTSDQIKWRMNPGQAGEFLDSLVVLEEGMQHFYVRAVKLKQAGGDSKDVDANLRKAVDIAEKVMPYRHH